MMPRTNYEMTEADLEDLLSAMRPTPVVLIGGLDGLIQQENANMAWARLGAKMGFDPITVRPAPGKDERFFTAVPNETDEAKAARLEREAEAKRAGEIATLEAEIAERKARLATLTK